MSQPYKEIIRDLVYGCKVLSLAFIFALFFWICVWGQPSQIPKGIYQGFAHGWSSQCVDWYRCEK